MKLDILVARQFFADFFYGENHLPGKIQPCGEGWQITSDKELASTDYNDLTRLVFMAHDQGIRVSIKAHTKSHLRIMLHPRDPFSDSSVLGHPCLDIARHRHLEWKRTEKDRYKVDPEGEVFVVEQAKSKAVRLFNLDGTLHDTYESMQDCASYLGVTRDTISKALTRNSILQGKFKIRAGTGTE